MKKENCTYYDNGYCKKGLPGTTCIDPATTEKGRCVAYYEGTPPIMIPSSWPAALTWQDIRSIVEIADKLVEKDVNGQLPEVCETEEGYYKAILEEFNKTRK